ncbi:MAG: penicillin-binding protein, partial [Ensifer adhaerens]|nr:penicillin-binding protein [Ensifer adhaerens]
MVETVREPRKDDNRPKKRHIFLRIDSWIDSTVWNAGFKLGQWWEDTTIFFRRFRVTGWKKAVFEVLGEGMNWGTVGSVLMLALALPAFEETKGN